MRDEAEVVVVGGGVAGATLASFLARAGRRVVVLDRARFPREKPCGEGLMPHGLDVLADLGLAERARAIGRDLAGVRYALPDGSSVAGSFHAPAPGRAGCALGVRRLALDALLLEAARDVGAEVVEGYRVRRLLYEGERVVGVSDGARELRARFVVGADGLRSTVRRLLGWQGGQSWPRRWAVTGHFRLPAERELPPEVLVVFAPGLEAYLTPLGGGEALLALLGGRSLMRRFAGDLRGGFVRAAGSFAPLRPLLDGAVLLPDVRATGPFAAGARRVAGDGVLLIGDAAGFLDPITGEGMAAALLQARAAARLLDRALATGSDDLSAYSAAHRRILRTADRLTWIALALGASPLLTRRAMAGLRRRPDLFEKLLAINCGQAGLGSVSPREWLALLAGV